MIKKSSFNNKKIIDKSNNMNYRKFGKWEIKISKIALVWILRKDEITGTITGASKK